jgi:hypothetical protein
VGQHEREGVGVGRPGVQETDPQPVDHRPEPPDGGQALLAPPPVVPVPPVRAQVGQLGQRDALARIGNRVVLAASAPQTAAMVGRRYEVHTIDIGELEKLEAGLTCLSVFLPA